MSLQHSTPAPGVALTRIDRAEARNAFTFAMYRDLAEAAARIGGDASVRVWVIAGREGKPSPPAPTSANSRASVPNRGWLMRRCWSRRSPRWRRWRSR